MPSPKDEKAQTLKETRPGHGVKPGADEDQGCARSAQILPFEAPQSQGLTGICVAECVDLAEARSERLGRRTVSGVFLYVPRF